MSSLPTIAEVLRQIVKKPATNLFPAKYLPPTITGYLAAVSEGRAAINPPIGTPPGFRGRVAYDRDTCIGCKLCTRICPANAIEFIPETKRIRIYVTQCVFCSQCTSICPTDSLAMSDAFLIATEDRFDEQMIVE